MTLYDFIAMNQTDQAEAVWKGNYLAAKEEEKHRVLLYKVENFYVEVYFHRELNLIQKFRPFTSTWRLQAYFNHRMN